MPRLTRPNRIQRTASRGQNLVELALTLPFVLLFIFFIVELGRVWFVYEGAKMAAMSGVHAASIYHSETVGQTELNNKLDASGLDKDPAGCTVTQIPNQHAYRADVKVKFTPFFGGITIPTVSGNIPLIPAAFDITYSAVEDVSVY